MSDDDTRSRAVALLRKAFQKKYEEAVQELEDLEQEFESPIEYIMAGALFGMGHWPRLFWYVTFCGIGGDEESCFDSACLPEDAQMDRVEIWPQAQIGPYRVDFLIRAGDIVPPPRHAFCVNLVVECDGHEFHENKQQAAVDRARDRYLQSRGYTVFRFTGSEIWASPANCCLEIAKFIDAEFRRHRGIASEAAE